MTRRPWTHQDDEILRRDYPSLGIDATAATLGRTRRAVRNRAYKLKVTRRAKRWSEIEDRRLMNALDEIGVGWTARRLGRTPRAIYERAIRIGIPMGRPPGFESIHAAAKRTGFESRPLKNILLWAGVTIRHSLSQPNARRQRTRLQHMVDIMDVDDAIAAWMNTETPYAAARRLGVDDGKIVSALLDSGLNLPPRPGGRRHWRIPSEIIDRALAARSERAA